MPSGDDIVHHRSGSPRRIAVVGASLTGLVVAYELHRRGFQITLFEASTRTGGHINTRREQGQCFETGPWAHLSFSPLVAELVGRLNLHDRIVHWSSDTPLPAILRNGTSHALPSSTIQYLTTGLWSISGKLRLVREIFIAARKPTTTRDESVESFLVRRLGKEVYEYGFAPLVRGRLAGNGTRLSARATFPKLVECEEEFGGIVRGMLSGNNTPPAQPFTFTNGLEELSNGLTAALGDRVHLDSTVRIAIPVKAGHFPVYHVAVERDGERETVQFDGVIFASNAHQTAEIIRPIDPETASLLRDIEYAPLANVYLAFDRASIPHIPSGPGLLIPASEQLNIVSTEWVGNLSTTSHDSRYWGCNVLLGGTDSRDTLNMKDDDLVGITAAELHKTFAFPLRPAFSFINRIEKAIPQYALRYPDVVKSLERFEANFHGTRLCGSFRGGQAFTAQVENGMRLAEGIATQEVA